MKKILFKWTKVKLKLNFQKEVKVYFKEREIWWTSIGINVGFEENGKNENFERPVLVIKKFNKHMFWGLPLTSKNKTGKYYHQFKYNNEKYSIILSQLKTISNKRLLRKIRTFPQKDFDLVKKKVKKFL